MARIKNAALFPVTKNKYVRSIRYPSLVISKEQNDLKENLNNESRVYYLYDIDQKEFDLLDKEKSIKILTVFPYFENNLSVIYVK